MKKLNLLLFIVVAMMLTNCSESVPIGYNGMVQTTDGLTGESLAPGRHSCYGFDKMILVEISESVTTEKMKILCKDNLNFGFDLKIRSRLSTSNGKQLKTILNKKGSAAINGVLKFKVLYNTYVRPEARSIARAVVSKYQTTEISENREKIDTEIERILKKAILGTPMKVTMVKSSNYDYPNIITKAMEKKREREIAVQQEKANQALELLKVNNRLKIAQKLRTTRLAEAQAEAAYIKVVGSVITDRYIKIRHIEAKKEFYTRVGVGDKVIVDANNITPIVTTK